MNALLRLFEMQTHHQVLVRTVIASLLMSIAAVFVAVTLWQLVFPNTIALIISQIRIMTFFLAFVLAAPVFYGLFFMSLKVSRKNRELCQLASLDPLTGIHNRRAFSARFTALLEKARRDGEMGTLLVIDVDKFKSINDRLGHDVGDQVLIHLAENLRTFVGTENCFARLGGEEFAVARFGITEADALNFAEKIRTGIQNTPLKTESLDISFTVSIGCCIIRANETLNNLLRNADVALYAAKRAGRNRTVCFDSTQAPIAPETEDLIHNLVQCDSNMEANQSASNRLPNSVAISSKA